MRTLTKILDDSSSAHRKLDATEGLQDAQLDDGARLHIVHSDIARGGHVIVNIRKFTGVQYRSLEELVGREMLTRETAQFLRACIQARLSVVFAGPARSERREVALRRLVSGFLRMPPDVAIVGEVRDGEGPPRFALDQVQSQRLA